MEEYRKPLPVPDDLSRPYWEGARRRQLMIQRCAACGLWIHHPKATCPRCGATDLRPAPVSGRGIVHTFTVSHYVGAPGFEGETPYVIVQVELEEQPGLRVVANLRDCPCDAVRVGLPVEVVFEAVTPDVTLPQFRPRRTDAS
jgi:uncharacterized OB-fold protein